MSIFTAANLWLPVVGVLIIIVLLSRRWRSRDKRNKEDLTDVSGDRSKTVTTDEEHDQEHPPEPKAKEHKEEHSASHDDHGGHHGSPSGWNAILWVVALAGLVAVAWFVQYNFSKAPAPVLRHNFPSVAPAPASTPSQAPEATPAPFTVHVPGNQEGFSRVVEGHPGFTLCEDLDPTVTHFTILIRDPRFHDDDPAHWFAETPGQVAIGNGTRYQSGDEHGFDMKVCFVHYGDACPRSCSEN